VKVKSVTKPPKEREFMVHGGKKKFKRIKYKPYMQEVLIVARATKTPAKNKRASKKKEVEVTDDEIDELDSVDELEDELEEQEVEGDELDEDEEDEEPPKRAAKKPRQSRAASDGMIGTNEIATKAGIDGRTLRMVLRKHNVKKDPETRRYQWKSWNDKTVKKILAWCKAGEADDIKKESLAKLKDSQEKKRAAKKGAESKKSGKKSSTKKKRSRPKDEDDE
jgi:hypothetical protein